MGSAEEVYYSQVLGVQLVEMELEEQLWYLDQMEQEEGAILLHCC